MFDLFWDYLLHVLFFRRRRGDVHFDLFQSPDGRHIEPDGYIIVRPNQIPDDPREPGEWNKPQSIAFTLENRYEARKLTRALAQHIHSEALLKGLSPMRLVWADHAPVTPYDGNEHVPVIEATERVSMRPPSLPGFILATR